MNPSICIPSMYKSISQSKIKQVFNNLKLGPINYIDIHWGPDFKRVCIYFKYWNSSSFAKEIRNKLLAGGEIKVIYDNPWFWKCHINQNDSPTETSNSNMYVSKYNTRNQLLALKDTLNEERAKFKKIVDEKNKKICYLEKIISLGGGDNALLQRKYIQQKRAQAYLDSSGILFY